LPKHRCPRPEPARSLSASCASASGKARAAYRVELCQKPGTNETAADQHPAILEIPPYSGQFVRRPFGHSDVNVPGTAGQNPVLKRLTTACKNGYDRSVGGYRVPGGNLVCGARPHRRQKPVFRPVSLNVERIDSHVVAKATARL